MSELFKQYLHLTLEPSNDSIFSTHHMILESGLTLIKFVHDGIVESERTDQINDALIIFQMVFGKGIAINQLIKGIEFRNSIDGSVMKGLKDPTTIAVLARTQFEAFANFHNIFGTTKEKELRDMLYNLWVISGLKYRQVTVKEDMLEEHREKAESEQKKIEKLVSEIETNQFYLELTEQDKSWVKERIKKKDFELLYKDGKFTKPGWRELFLNAGVNDVFMHLYSLMSLSTHPSNVSVFQYAQMYQLGFNEEMAYTFMSHSTIIMSFMISEYCHLFPLAKEKFKELPELNQLIIDSYNGNFRGREYEISEIRNKYAEEFQQEFEKLMRVK